MTDSKIDKILNQIDQEVENSNVGHEAYNKTKNMRKFSQGNIENIVLADPHGDEDHTPHEEWDAHSTFDEENYSIGYDEDN
jgi:hypothetical protein|tara:strand:- start:1385 stop:1627 length:243 start_codon:yes stop_codon:yes gene_type:complete